MSRRNAGFTLIEIMLAVAITAMIMTTVGSAFLGILNAREEVRALSESTSSGPRVLAMIERDLRGLWHHNIKDNKVLLGENRDIAGFDADRINLLVHNDAMGVVIDDLSRPHHPTVCEVGYWLRENERSPGLRELWRREDPMVDDNLIEGGTFQLVHDRIKNLNITYYTTLGANAEPIHEWDSSREATLPRRIKIELSVERPLANRNRVSATEFDDFEETVKKYTRHIVFDRRFPDILKGGVAMRTVFPPPPESTAGGSEEGGEGGGGNAAVVGNGMITQGISTGDLRNRPGAPPDGRSTNFTASPPAPRGFQPPRSIPPNPTNLINQLMQGSGNGTGVTGSINFGNLIGR